MVAEFGSIRIEICNSHSLSLYEHRKLSHAECECVTSETKSEYEEE